ncbi:hypothetical protein Gotur_009931 [Gossypium turneri]
MSCREGLMSPQTETKASIGIKAGVKDYKLTYYTPEYEVKDTDILAAFPVTPQHGVPLDEVRATVAVESSAGTWTSIWTSGLTNLDRYKGRCYHIEPIPGEEDQCRTCITRHDGVWGYDGDIPVSDDGWSSVVE